MQLFDPNNPNEKKKIIVAAALGVAALLVLGYVFFGGSSSKPPANQRVSATPAPVKRPTPPPGDGEEGNDVSTFQPVPISITVPPVSETRRNIFAYYEPPPPTPKTATAPIPSPTPPPPVTISALSPSNVYSRTPSDFALQIMGEKFTPALHIIIDGRDLPTRFINPQQVATTVPAAMITNPGNRQVMLRSNDGTLYSNAATFTVTQPPTPNYNYVGIIGKRSFNDTAVLQDKSSKEILNVQRGDVAGGRFRVNSISEREIVFIDTTLKIRHTIPFSSDTSANPLRPSPRVADEEPER